MNTINQKEMMASIATMTKDLNSASADFNKAMDNAKTIEELSSALKIKDQKKEELMYYRKAKRLLEDAGKVTPEPPSITTRVLTKMKNMLPFK